MRHLQPPQPDQQKQSNAAAPKHGSGITTWPIYVALVIVFIFYVFSQSSGVLSILFGAILFFLIIIALVIEFSIGIKEEGYKKNLAEVAIAIIIVAIIWFGMRFLLNTPYPLDVVPSCSMLPVLHRGDMIVLQGAGPSNLKAPIINVSPQAMRSNITNLQNLALECVSYSVSNGKVTFYQYYNKGDSIGLYSGGTSSGQMVPYGSQTGIVKYLCGIVNVTLQDGSVVQEASLTGITVGNTMIYGDRNNSIIVYQTDPNSLFYAEGDSYVVHRIYAILNASGSYYYLTKGDNNPGLDIQFHAAGYYNYPVNQSEVEGKVVGDIPYLGYIKLILSNSFQQPPGCNSTITG
jgi:signal peptidase I